MNMQTSPDCAYISIHSYIHMYMWVFVCVCMCIYINYIQTNGNMGKCGSFFHYMLYNIMFGKTRQEHSQLPNACYTPALQSHFIFCIRSVVPQAQKPRFLAAVFLHANQLHETWEIKNEMFCTERSTNELHDTVLNKILCVSLPNHSGKGASSISQLQRRTTKLLY